MGTPRPSAVLTWSCCILMLLALYSSSSSTDSFSVSIHVRRGLRDPAKRHQGEADRWTRQQRHSIPPGLDRPPPAETLGFSSIYVVHLPHREDRRARMETLATVLGLKITWVQAEGAESWLVGGIMEQVRQQRIAEGWNETAIREEVARGLPKLSTSSLFRSAGASLPPLFDARHVSYFLGSPHPSTEEVVSKARWQGWDEGSIFLPDAWAFFDEPAAELGEAGADLWEHPLPLHKMEGSQEQAEIPCLQGTTMQAVLADQMGSNPPPPGLYNTRRSLHVPSERTKWWNRLSSPMVACWLSHVRALKQFVAEGGESALFLEDDVDMEWDIAARVDKMRPDLPADWDLVALGHCWSEESFFPPLTPTSTLRQAYMPKCNHAYAVSRKGALRLLRHLRSPAFAYSRAFDQAIVHLIATGRLRAFSTYPSVVIQTKETSSDIVQGVGSRWRDVLEDGVLARLKAAEVEQV